jgi:hypothetical protein
MVDNKQGTDEDMFEAEEPQARPKSEMPRPTPVLDDEADDALLIVADDDSDVEDDESYFEVVEPFETTGGFVCSLTVIQENGGEKFVAVQMDNVTVELPLQDVIEMLGGFGRAIPALLEQNLQG